MDAPTPNEHFNETIMDFIDRAAKFDPASTEATTAIKNIEALSKIHFLPPAPETIPDPVPTTVWEKTKVYAAKIWDNETTRVLIKAGGAFGGVWFVTRTTVKMDHVLERQAIAQANQRSI